MNIGIIGNEGAKFTPESELKARLAIRNVIYNSSLPDRPTIISGHCHLGGIDIWAEEEGKKLNCPLKIYTPKQLQWDSEYGFKKRNLDIAITSDFLYVIVVDKYPPNYKGMKFNSCYHCKTSDHVKSGACWTAKQYQQIHNKDAIYIKIPN